jgi:hypothetical protein
MAALEDLPPEGMAEINGKRSITVEIHRTQATTPDRAM